MVKSKPILAEPLRERLLQPDVISGSDMLLRSLLLENVECVFGYPGGAVLYIYDAFYGFDGFRHVLARHEQGAIHAADGYARASGKTGVCIATSGPGATNLITGIAVAHKDHTPLVIVTGNVPYASRGTDSFQEADVIGMTLPITKHNFYITDAGDIPGTVREAFRIASTGRPGPVLIDIPKDISAQRKAFLYRESRHPYTPADQPDDSQWEVVLNELAQATRPLLFCGEGIDHAGAYRELLAFAEKGNIPVVVSSHSVGCFPAEHSLALGIAGRCGDVRIEPALRECDVLIVVGSRLDERMEWVLNILSPDARIVHLDYDVDVGAKRLVHAGSYGNPAKLLHVAAGRVKELATEGWIERLRAGADRKAAKRSADSGNGLTAAEAFGIVAEFASSDMIVTVDEHQYHCELIDCLPGFAPRSLVCPVGMEAPGFSLPAAIGAQVAHPDRTVISISGEAGFVKCAQELAVCSIHKIGVKFVVLSQRDRSHAANPDFVRLAQAYGLAGHRADRTKEAQVVWAKAMETKGPVLVEFQIER